MDRLFGFRNSSSKKESLENEAETEVRELAKHLYEENTEISKEYETQKLLNMQLDQLLINLDAAENKISRYNNVSKELAAEFKEIGDLENLTAIIEQEVKLIVEQLKTRQL